MQIPFETFISAATEPGTAQSSVSAGVPISDIPGGRFFDVLHTQAFELPLGSSGEPGRELPGIRLPSTGNTLPAAHPEPPLQRGFDVDLPYPNPAQRLQSGEEIDITTSSNRSLDVIDETDIDLPAAGYAVETDRGGDSPRGMDSRQIMSNVGQLEYSPQRPMENVAANSYLTNQNRVSTELNERTQALPDGPAKPTPVVLPLRDPRIAPPDGTRMDRHAFPRDSRVDQVAVQKSPALPSARVEAAALQGEPKVILRSAVSAESAFDAPRPISTSDSQLPAMEVAGKLSLRSLNQESLGSPNSRSASRPQIRNDVEADSDTATLAIAKDNKNNTNSSDGTMRASPKTKMPQELHGVKLSPSPPVQPTVTAGSIGAANPVTSASTIATVVAVETPVFDPKWAEAIHQRVSMLAGVGIQSAEIRLNPAELGPLQVRISIEDNSANIAFGATQAVTREALEFALPRLKEMLAENGLMLADASVSDQDITKQRDDENDRGSTDIDPGEDDTASTTTDLSRTTHKTKKSAGLLDTFV